MERIELPELKKGKGRTSNISLYRRFVRPHRVESASSRLWKIDFPKLDDGCKRRDKNYVTILISLNSASSHSLPIYAV